MTQRLDGPSSAVKMRAMKRDRFRCTYCGVPGTDAELEIDHIIAVSRGGSHHIGNLATACRACNQQKGAGCAPQKHKPMSRTEHPLVGMWLHTFNGEDVQYQGQILGVDGDIVLVQLYEWFAGSPSCIQPMARDLMYSAACKLYPTNEHMNDAYEVHSKRREREIEAAGK